jgi:hypothetical protein
MPLKPSKAKLIANADNSPITLISLALMLMFFNISWRFKAFLPQRAQSKDTQRTQSK